MNRIGEQLTMVPRILARVLEPGWVMAGLPLRLALMLAQEASGVTYNWVTNTLFVAGDGGTSIVQVSKTGGLIDSMTLAPGGGCG